MKDIKQIIEQPAIVKLDDATRIDTSLGVAIGVGTAATILALAVVKNIINCYQHYSQMLSNVEKTTALLAEMKADIKNDFAVINQSIKELQISLNVSQARILVIERSIEDHAQKIAVLEASTNRIIGRLGDP